VAAAGGAVAAAYLCPPAVRVAVVVAVGGEPSVLFFAPRSACLLLSGVHSLLSAALKELFLETATTPAEGWYPGLGGLRGGKGLGLLLLLLPLLLLPLVLPPLLLLAWGWPSAGMSGYSAPAEPW
jgi:hypothetical protein